MQKRIAFLTSSHLPKDDRIYYHLATSLYKNGYAVSIICSTALSEDSNSSIPISGFIDLSFSKSEKVNKLFNLIIDFNPDIIVCSEPLPIIVAKKFKKLAKRKIAIIYDITEWYPSKKNLANLNWLKKIISFVRLLLFNLYASFFCDAFIFGEHYKSQPYKILFPFKKSVKVGYYVNIEYINYAEPLLNNNKICLGYTGNITADKGIENFLEAAKMITQLKKEIKIKLKIVGLFPDEKYKTDFIQKLAACDGIEYEIEGYQEFRKYSDAVQDINIFFDLRKTDFENNRCLPIKLFYYTACGRPVIYSNLKSIRKELDISHFGYLVNPLDSKYIAECVIRYINDPDLYYQHCMNARGLAETLYNWKNIEPDFLKFIADFTGDNIS